MPTRRHLLLLTTALLAACNPHRRPPVDPATLQTPAAEAVLRYVITTCPAKAQAKFAVIGIGENLGQPRPDFVEKFKDVEGLEFLEHTRVVAGMAGGKSRRFDEKTEQPVLEVQISSITEPKNGVQEAVAAWAFKDDAVRKRYEVKAKEGGGFDIKELETIEVPSINDDRRSARGKE
jgi:hypothetical protein